MRALLIACVAAPPRRLCRRSAKVSSWGAAPPALSDAAPPQLNLRADAGRHRAGPPLPSAFLGGGPASVSGFALGFIEDPPRPRAALSRSLAPCGASLPRSRNPLCPKSPSKRLYFFQATLTLRNRPFAIPASSRRIAPEFWPQPQWHFTAL